MKHLFFVAVAGGIFSGTTISVSAQTNARVERLEARVQSGSSPKFIEGIEMIPGGSLNTVEVAVEVTKSGKPVTSGFPIVKSGFDGSIEHSCSLQFKYAVLMNREVESITNIPLYNFIDEWWATSYHYGGKDSSGIDCSAFTGKLLSAVYGSTVPRTAKDQYKICEKLAIEELVEGDLVFFNTRGYISHVGLYLGNNLFVHSSVHDGVTISSLADEYYRKKFFSGGRILRSLKGEQPGP